MAFLQPDDYLLLMDTNDRRPFYGFPLIPCKHDDLLRLKDAGIKTVVEYFGWDLAEKKMGEIDWEECDELIGRVTGAGLRCVLSGYNEPLQCAPVDWYAKFRSGRPCLSILSFWNEDAQAYAREFYAKVVERYQAADVQVVMCEYLTGESALHNQPCYYDKAAVDDYRHWFGPKAEPEIETQDTRDWLSDQVVKHFVATQQVLKDQHGEVWEDLQWLIAQQSPHNGNSAQPCIQTCCHQAMPDTRYVLIQYTYFAHGSVYFDYVKQLRQDVPIDLIVEAQYCDGLVKGSPSWAIEHQAIGQIVAPLHPFKQKLKLEDWMVDAIRGAVLHWQAHGHS